MEILITISNLLLLGLIIITPLLLIYIIKKREIRFPLISYSLISLFGLGILILLFAWWSYKSDLILLKHYGYNINGMTENEFYGNVLPKNIEKVKTLETSIMGIGWPLKAIFGYITFIPYLIIIYLGKILIDKLKNNKNSC